MEKNRENRRKWAKTQALRGLKYHKIDSKIKKMSVKWRENGEKREENGVKWSQNTGKRGKMEIRKERKGEKTQG